MRRVAITAAAVLLCLLPGGLAAGSKAGAADDAGGEQTKGAKPAKPTGPPKLDAKTWILVDPLDGEVLAAHAANRERPIASATKLMTTYLALHSLKPSQKLRAPDYHASSSEESLLDLYAGEKITVKDLLYAMLLPSANDAAETIADGVAGNEKRFVAQMNRAARRLGLTHTRYANPIGLDDPHNYSSASDLVKLAGILLRNRLFARIVDTPSATLRSGQTVRRVTTRNTLLLDEPWVVGVKTGHTSGAGYVLVAAGRRNGTTLLSAVLGTSSEERRDAESLKLLDYGFSQYRAKTPVRRGQELADPSLDYRSDHLPLIAKRTVPVSIRRGQRLTTQVRSPDQITGSVEKGEPLGRVLVRVDGRLAAASPLVAAHSVAAPSLAQKGFYTARQPLVLIPAGLFVIVVGLLLTTRGRHHEEEEAEQPPPSSPGAPVERQPAEPPPAPAAEPKPKRRLSLRRRQPRQRTPEERRRMHAERMKRRRNRSS
jgi:D-alanyl-D-alanine carboxypeptidase (penicillin-binding protein 5/6)